MRKEVIRSKRGKRLLPVSLLVFLLVCVLAVSGCCPQKPDMTDIEDAAGVSMSSLESEADADAEADSEEDAESDAEEDAEPEEEAEKPEAVIDFMEEPVRLVYTRQYEAAEQFETEDELMIAACVDALREMTIGEETDVRATDSDDVLTFVMEDGSANTVRFQNGNFCFEDRIYEVGGFSAVRDVLEQVASAVTEESSGAGAGQAYGIDEIPAHYAIYKNADADFSFLYADTFEPQELEGKSGAIVYTDEIKVNYFAVFADSSEGLSTEEYLSQVGEHFMETARQNQYEVYEEPKAVEPLTISGRTLQGICYGYQIEGVKLEYTDYIEEITDGREKNVMLYEQHVLENSGEATALALQDAVASYANASGYYESIPVAEAVEPAGDQNTDSGSETTTEYTYESEYYIGENELAFASEQQDFAVVLPDYVKVSLRDANGTMIVYCSGEESYPVLEISRVKSGPDAKATLQESLTQLSGNPNAYGVPLEVENVTVNGRSAYRISYTLQDSQGAASGRTTMAMDLDDGIALFDATYYDTGISDLNQVLTRATESFKPGAAAYLAG
ncbi:MAG: hypothetical protein IJ860_06300 [Eubacterium sp.]|nr:hypothetical protein [Eubacterium sp.]